MAVMSVASPRSEAATAFPPFKHSPTSKQLGGRIRHARLARGYSQGDVALRMGLAKQTISQWETGECTPQLKSLIQFASVLEVDAAYFLTGLSADLEPSEMAQRRRDVASQVVPLHSLQAAGAILSRQIDPRDARAIRHVPTLSRHPERSIAFTVQGDAMVANQPGPSFSEGDVVTLAPATMAQRGQVVLAQVDGAFIFRRFLPAIPGRVDGAVLRALNSDYHDVVMGKSDAILGVLKEHIRNY
jgi:transcriptional regulator with XRE-family HTH domain